MFMSAGFQFLGFQFQIRPLQRTDRWTGVIVSLFRCLGGQRRWQGANYLKFGIVVVALLADYGDYGRHIVSAPFHNAKG
jgi:hypothetical protein